MAAAGDVDGLRPAVKKTLSLAESRSATPSSTADWPAFFNPTPAVEDGKTTSQHSKLVSKLLVSHLINSVFFIAILAM
jgi:hypothetical protein